MLVAISHLHRCRWLVGGLSVLDLTPDQQCKLTSNAEYQKVVPIIMNLAAASLVVPVVLAKEFRPLNSTATVPFPKCWAIAAWGFLALSLACGCVFHYASAKLVKALYGGYDNKGQVTFLESMLVKPWHQGKWDPKTWRENSYESLRDVSVWALLFLFFFGLGCLVGFMVPYLRAV
jgi:hypothetical protein